MKLDRKQAILYGTETWLITRHKVKVSAVEMDAITRSMRISRPDRIRNGNN